MNTSTIRTVSEFIKIIEEFDKETLHQVDGNASKKLLFRGQADIKWQFLPGLFREKKYYDNEGRICSEVERQFPEEFKGLSQMDKVIKLQHYGAPTRLLDFTGNPLVALYFACSTEIDRDGVVCAHNMPVFSSDSPYMMLYQNIIFDPSFDSVGTVNGEKIDMRNMNTTAGIMPYINNQRMRNQDGYFAFFGYNGAFRQFNSTPLDPQMNDIFLIAQITIPKEEKKHLLKDLSTLGIKKSFLFPELENQIKSIVEDIVSE